MVGPLRVLSKGHTGEGIGRQGRLFITKCPGEDNKELALTCDFLGCYIKHELQGGAGVSSRPLQAAWPHKMGAEATVLGSSSAKRSMPEIYSHRSES